MAVSLCVGDRTFALELCERGGQWTAEARDAATGLPAGPAAVADTAEAAVERVTRWLEWQQEHALVLERLQECERAYHRLVTGSAFGSVEMSDLQREALLEIEDARRRLDAVRQRQPR